jgi:hypothetical protein
MRKGLSIMMVLGLLVTPWAGMCGQEGRSESKNGAPLQVASSLRFNTVIISLQSGSSVGGLLAGVENEAVILLKKGQEEKIPRQEIRRITIVRETSRSRTILPVVLLGTYLGNVVLFRSEDEPPFYADFKNEWSSWGIVFWETIVFGASTGLGFLLSGILESREKVFEFGESGKENLEMWERLKRFVLGADDYKKIHLSFQGGRVFPRISDNYKAWFQTGYNAEYIKNPIYFNMLRKIQLSYSMKPQLDIGLAISWLGEPTLYGYNQTEYQAYSPYWGYYTASSYRWIQQKYSSTGYFAVGIYRPFFNQVPRNLTWNVGLGVGALKTKFSLESHISYPIYMTESSTISKQQFGALAFTELNLNLVKNISFGFGADYVFAPPIQAAALPETGIPAQRLRGVNGSVGFSLGLHF